MDRLGEICRKRKGAHAKQQIGQTAQPEASAQEILEAVEVAMEMGGGPAAASARFALDVMDSVFGE